MNRKVYNGTFGLLMVMCVVLVALILWYGITNLEMALAVLYVGVGGYFVGLSWNRVSRVV